MTMIDWVSDIFLLLGGLLALTGAVGLLRLPDFYTRMHAASVTESLAATLLIIGIILDTGFTLDAAKLILLILIMIVVNPTITHALSRAAAHGGVTPEVFCEKNQKNQEEAETELSDKGLK
ncbi:MAG: monovalent cation/H(+) antiporter subunit G [Campylobacterota bacterium]|nr:monovalent cation/H(+) antiporter subunit G [Campylobacterota bacterium]